MVFRGKIVAALGAALALGPVAAAQAQSQEKCYGVALAGESDGVGSVATKGSSTVNYQGDAWVMVPAGTCLTRPLPAQADGTPRRGSLEPLDRDKP